MPGLYARWMDRWETRLAMRDSNRLVRPFDWGLDWLGLTADGTDPRRLLFRYNESAVGNSDSFFAYSTPGDYRLDGAHLTFTSPLCTPHPENNTVHAEYFPARRSRGRALVVLPQWNSDVEGHLGLCRLLNYFGVTALRMSLAYHDRRMPEETERADYHVSSNVGRTVHACRQSVTDTRACLDWLVLQGYDRLGVLGTSLGSCIAFIAAVHDPRVRVAILNHVSTWFGDVVWTGLSTRHVQAGLEGALTQDELRQCWAVISPASYFGRLAARDLRAMLIWAKYDTTFLPGFSQDVLKAFRTHRTVHKVLSLNCGHYTTGEFPFKYLDGFAMCRFAARHL